MYYKEYIKLLEGDGRRQTNQVRVEEILLTSVLDHSVDVPAEDAQHQPRFHVPRILVPLHWNLEDLLINTIPD